MINGRLPRTGHASRTTATSSGAKPTTAGDDSNCAAQCARRAWACRLSRAKFPVLIIALCCLESVCNSLLGPRCLNASAEAAPTVILVVGAEGEPEYGREFAAAADRWAAAAAKASAKLVTIGRDAPPGAGAAPAAPATTRSAATRAAATTPATQPTDKDRLRQAIAAAMGEASEHLWLVLLGHGTFDRKEAKFNLRGPDVSDLELAEWLRPCKRPLAVIDCSSSSAPFLNRLSASGRVVITATASGHELQFSRFGQYLSAAVADPSADLDKDGQVSLLEAFLAASHRTEEFYKQEGRLATEHALLDDNGDARGTPATFFSGFRATRAAANNAPLDGPRAHQWHLVLTAAEQAMPPEARKKRDELELRIEALRAKKATLPEADYYAQLEPLLLDLARLYDAADRKP